MDCDIIILYIYVCTYIKIESIEKNAKIILSNNTHEITKCHRYVQCFFLIFLTGRFHPNINTCCVLDTILIVHSEAVILFPFKVLAKGLPFIPPHLLSVIYHLETNESEKR